MMRPHIIPCPHGSIWIIAFLFWVIHRPATGCAACAAGTSATDDKAIALTNLRVELPQNAAPRSGAADPWQRMMAK